MQAGHPYPRTPKNHHLLIHHIDSGPPLSEKLKKYFGKEELKRGARPAETGGGRR